MNAEELASQKIREITTQYWNFKQEAPEKSIVTVQAMMDCHAFEMDVSRIRHNDNGRIMIYGVIDGSERNLVLPLMLFDRMAFMFTAVQPGTDAEKAVIGFQP